MSARADDRGVHLPPGPAGSGQVYFEGAPVWSFSLDEDPDNERHAAWPPRMRPWLEGRARVRIEFERGLLLDDEVTFGALSERIRFVDQHGIGVMFDKWGLLQRPFSARPRTVVEEMLDRTERILEIMRSDCGLQGWIAFGTLLGAAREGKVIGHDSDVDLAYLSERPTPAQMSRELWGLVRALRAHGLRVLVKSGSFVTVVFTSADGAQASIDIYTCFYVGDLLYETATVRLPVPRSAVSPLTTIAFEGRTLPAPADVDALLAASYGPTWRIPDPSFSHQPGPETKRRFDGWFSSLMRHRRDWETALVNQRSSTRGASPFARWVAARLEPGVNVVDIGAGTGRDARLLARRGFDVVALDYARRGSGRNASQPATADDSVAGESSSQRGRPERREPSFGQLNLYDYRDVVTRGALLSRRGGSSVVYARQVLDRLDPDGMENFWRLVQMVLYRGGTAYLECRGETHRLEQQILAAGGEVLERHEAGPRLGRLVASWPDRTQATEPTSEAPKEQQP